VPNKRSLVFVSRSLQIVEADWLAPSNVVAFTTTRHGGFSQPPFDSFNLAQHVDDQPSVVARNRQVLVSQFDLPSEPVWLEQVHSTKVLEIDSGLARLQPADGLITASPKVVCAVMTADCMPLFLSDRAGSKVAVVHAGWRGMADGIIEKAVGLFNQPPEQIIAWAGPTIGPKHFEIGPEVKEQLMGPEEAYVASSNNGKLLADLYLLAGQRLAGLGVHNYTHCAYCSYTDEQLFYSYRRSKAAGRMASIIYFT
jgi:YfiH family protein